MLTKNDLSQIKNIVQEVTRPQINGLDMKISSLQQSTKKDMKSLETGLKNDMKDLEKGLRGKIETGLEGLEKRLIERIDEAQMEIIATVDKHKADKARVDILEKRVVRLEDNSGLPPYIDQ